MGYQVLDDMNVRSTFYQGFSTAESGLMYPSLVFPMPSSHETESHKWLGTVPQMREWVGARLVKRVRDEAWTLTNVPYEATMDIPLDMVRRDQTGQIMARVRELGGRAATHPDALLTTLIEGNGLCYDGQNFFDTDHSSGSSGTLANAVTASEVPALNVATAADPTEAEMSLAILRVLQHFLTFKDDQGEPINQNARSFTAMVPVNMFASATNAVTLDLIGSGSDNPLKKNKLFTVNVVPNARLTGTTVFYLMRNDGHLKPFIHQIEVPVETRLNTVNEFGTRHHEFGVWTSQTMGFGLWQHAIKATLS